ncbi:MAG: Cof-type HAD-IIB family hydrolase [Proteobacteria bacterium]|nr:Cof-type HAD-IIB family hydrolase [Pseudomonadota bacterium]
MSNKMPASTGLKALAIDLDGTLLVGEDLSPRNRDAVKRASQAGYHVIIATARWRQLAERIAREIGLENPPIIACSGAQVYCMREARDIYDARLPADFVEAFYEICNANRCIATASVDAHTWFKIDQKPSAEYLSDELHWVEAFPPVDQLPRIATVQGSGTIELVKAMHSQGFDETVNIFNSIGPTGRNVVTITAKNADKGIALTRACDYLNIQTSAVVAFGDAENDIAMFRLAGQSVAMGQAEDAVKAEADVVTLPNTEDGVADFIESVLL